MPGTSVTEGDAESFLRSGFDIILSRGDRAGERLRSDGRSLTYKGVKIPLGVISAFGHQSTRKVMGGKPSSYLWELALELEGGGKLRTKWGVSADDPEGMRATQQFAYDYVAVLLHTQVRPRLVDAAMDEMAANGQLLLANVAVRPEGFMAPGTATIPWRDFSGAPVLNGNIQLRMQRGGATPTVLAEIPMAQIGALLLPDVLRRAKAQQPG